MSRLSLFTTIFLVLVAVGEASAGLHNDILNRHRKRSSSVAVDLASPSTSGSLSGLKYTGVGGQGSYQQVVSMPPGEWPSCNVNPSCVKSTKTVSGNLAPFNEDQSVVFEGPMTLYNIAVYQPPQPDDTSAWSLVSSWKANSAPDNLVFMNNMGGGASGTWSSESRLGTHGSQTLIRDAVCQGASQSFSNGSFTGTVADQNEQLYSGVIPATFEVVRITNRLLASFIDFSLRISCPENPVLRRPVTVSCEALQTRAGPIQSYLSSNSAHLQRMIPTTLLPFGLLMGKSCAVLNTGATAAAWVARADVANLTSSKSCKTETTTRPSRKYIPSRAQRAPETTISSHGRVTSQLPTRSYSMSQPTRLRYRGPIASAGAPRAFPGAPSTRISTLPQ